MIRKKYALERDFILFVGMIEPRKNLGNLVDAFLSDSLPQVCDLVLAGSFGWGIQNCSGKSELRMTRGPSECWAM